MPHVHTRRPATAQSLAFPSSPVMTLEQAEHNSFLEIGSPWKGSGINCSSGFLPL